VDELRLVIAPALSTASNCSIGALYRA